MASSSPGRLSRAAYIASNIAKNAAAPLVLPRMRDRGSLGMDGLPHFVIATLDQLGRGLETLDFSLRDSVVLELGPGRTPEVALAFALAGAGAVTGLDSTLQIPPDWQQRANTVRELLQAPGCRRFRPSPQRQGDVHQAASRVSFLAYDGIALPLPDACTDLIVSKSVLEHVASAHVGRLIDEMSRVLRPGGAMVHMIDLRDHMFIDADCVTGDWLDALRYPPSVFAAMFSNRSTSINRLRACEWCELLEARGFELAGVERHRYALPDGFACDRLRPPWRSMSPDELQIGQVLIPARLRR